MGRTFPDPVNGEEERNQSNRHTAKCAPHPIQAVGIDAQSLPTSYPRHLAKIPSRWAQLAPCLAVDGAVNSLSPDSDLIWVSHSFLPLCFIPVFFSRPSFLTTHQNDRQIRAYWPYRSSQGQRGLQEMGPGGAGSVAAYLVRHHPSLSSTLACDAFMSL